MHGARGQLRDLYPLIQVYLAGAITDYEDPRTWRARAKELLLDPLMAVDPQEHEVDYSDPKGVVRTDLNLIRGCQALLIDARAPSWGTAMEVYHAWRTGKINFGWGAPSGASPWLRAYVDLYPTLDEAVAAIRKRYDV